MQRCVAEIVHFSSGLGIRPSDNLVEDSEMRKASDATAAKLICPAGVTIFEKSLDVAQQVL